MPKITGAGAVTKKLQQVSERLIEPVGQALFVAADEMKAEASRLITQNSAAGQKGGKHGHVRSLPGQPPNEEFGDLRKGIVSERTGPLSAQVTSNARHSAPLEFGTSKMAARPFMAPALRAKKKRVRELVAAAVKHAMKEV